MTGHEELLAEENWEDVEGMTFGIRLVLVSLGIFIGAGIVLGTAIGFGIAGILGAL